MLFCYFVILNNVIFCVLYYKISYSSATYNYSVDASSLNELSSPVSVEGTSTEDDCSEEL